MGERSDEPTYAVSWFDHGRNCRVSMTYRRDHLREDVRRFLVRRASGDIDSIVVVSRNGDVTMDFFG